MRFEYFWPLCRLVKAHRSAYWLQCTAEEVEQHICPRLDAEQLVTWEEFQRAHARPDQRAPGFFLVGRGLSTCELTQVGTPHSGMWDGYGYPYWQPEPREFSSLDEFKAASRCPDGRLEPVIRAQIGRYLLELVYGDLANEQVDAIVTPADDAQQPWPGPSSGTRKKAYPDHGNEVADDAAAPPQDWIRMRQPNDGGPSLIYADIPPVSDDKREAGIALVQMYWGCLSAAASEGCATIALPALACRPGEFAVQEAVSVALSTVIGFCKKEPALSCVRFVVDDGSIFSLFAERLTCFSDARLTEQAEVLLRTPAMAQGEISAGTIEKLAWPGAPRRTLSPVSP